MKKCYEQFGDILDDMKGRMERGEINGDAVQTLYLGLIAGYLATIVDELQELNDRNSKIGDEDGNNTGND